MSRWVFLGMPGAGKGTQAKRLARQAEVPHVSTGDMFRAALSEGTPAGLEAKKYLDAGQLVPDEVVVQMVEERLAAADCERGFILDGFPRTLAQAQALQELLRRLGTDLQAVLFFQISEEEAVRRLLDRAHKEGRADDTPEVIKERLKVYHDETAPLVDFYQGVDLLERIRAEGSIEEVFERLLGKVTF